jgi:hypothetical protein
MTVLSINGLPCHEINDDNWQGYVPDASYCVKDNQGNEYFTGCLPVEEWDVASMATREFESSGIVMYDEREIRERLEDMWAAQASLMHFGYQFDCLRQTKGTCWIHGTCQAAGVMLAKAGLPYRVPSPASVAYHCYTNFGVNGGYPSLGVQKFQEHGAARVELWGENAHDRRLDTVTTKADRIHQMLEEVVVLGSGEQGFWRCMSAICQGIPTGISLSWWRHYVEAPWGRVDRGEVKIGARNTWGNNGYGDKGYGLLAGSRKYPSWSCAFLRMRQSPGAT